MGTESGELGGYLWEVELLKFLLYCIVVLVVGDYARLKTGEESRDTRQFCLPQVATKLSVLS